MAAIYQSSITSDKPDILITNPFVQYVYFNDGAPLAFGKLYFGVPSRDGRLEENRKKVYIIEEDGNAISIEQPVVLSGGGVAQYNGEPVSLAVDGSYSLAVDDFNDVQEYFEHTVIAKSLLGYSGVIPEESKPYVAGKNIVYDKIEATTASFYASTVTDGSAFKGQYLRKDVDYEAINESTIKILTTLPANTIVLGRALDPTGQTVNVTNNTEPMYIYPVKSDAVISDLQIGDNVLINGGDQEGDGKGGSYLVVAGGTGTADNYTYIDLDNGNQLKIKSIYQVFQGYYELVSNAILDSGKMTIDPTEGNITKLTVTENITEIEVLNAPADGELKLQLKLKQDPATPRTITWSINGVAAKSPGGTLPTFTNTVDAIDEYIITSDDGGSNWFIYTIGQDIK